MLSEKSENAKREIRKWLTENENMTETKLENDRPFSEKTLDGKSENDWEKIRKC